MKVNRVEQHVISKTNLMWKLIDEYCFRSKNLYNQANYLIRQEFIKSGKWLRHTELDKLLQSSNCYKQLGSQAAQKTLQILDKSWKSYINSSKDWSVNKDKYLGRPKMPKYKDKNKGRFILTLKNIQCRIESEWLLFSWKPFSDFKIKTKIIDGRLMQVRFIPRGRNYVAEIVYEITVPEVKINSKRIASIDIGINNLATVSNNINRNPYIINGKPIKSINQYFNKVKATIQSSLMKRHKQRWSNKLQTLADKRHNKIKNYMHESSRLIVKWCIDNQIDTLVVGNNDKWKQKVSMGKRNNQNFSSIPFEMLISQLRYKCQNVGIKFIETEESYTSGTSFIDDEPPTKTFYNTKRRIKRGLFKSNEGKLINADLNGSYQIMKKVFPNVFSDGIEGVGLHPVRINPNKWIYM